MACSSGWFTCFNDPSGLRDRYDADSDDEDQEVLIHQIARGSEKSEGADYQHDLWQLTLKQKVEQARRYPVPIILNPKDELTPEISLEILSTAYSTNGLAQRIPRVKQVFLTVEPFVQTISTMTQASAIASLVWGSLTLIFKCILRFTNLFDSIIKILSDLANSLPRYRAYADIFHTPRLHNALRVVYEGFIDFCFETIEILDTNRCGAMMRGRWPRIVSEFDKTRLWLDAANFEFEQEAQLANVQEQVRRHNEVMSTITSLASTPSTDAGVPAQLDPITNVGLPRNEKFTGRVSVLESIHIELSPSFQGNILSRSRCSCLVHAVGGMGKTDTALEYTYRYKNCYSHVFWLRAQSSSTLLESFLEVVAKLGLDEDKVDATKKVQSGLNWFQATISNWLLVFDNVEDADTIRSFWPLGSRGAILMTSQDPHLAHMTKSQIFLQPMDPEEGSILIQSYLNRGGSEKESAQALSATLGGLPLAIAHFAGYVVRSQCPLDQICNSFRNRIKSSQMWKTNIALPNSTFEQTLATVWELAFSRLTSDARKLLEFLAFLDPDQVPVEMFVGPKTQFNTPSWKYCERERVNAAIGILRERHLVERYMSPAGDSLRTHRALQRAMLHGLDTDLHHRQNVFDEVVAIARNVFPKANIIVRGDTSRYVESAKYIIQVVSIHTAFTQSEPAIEGKLEFAQLQCDVGYYGVNNAIQAHTVAIMKTAESICTRLLEIQTEEVLPVLGDILGPLQVMIQYLGISGRKEAHEITKRVISIREQQKAGIPQKIWTKLDFVNFGRAYNDVGVSLSQLNRVEEASQWFDEALSFYKLAGDEESLTSRFGHIYSFQLLPLAVRQKENEARSLAQRSLALVSKAVGLDSPLYIQTKFIVAMLLFTTGSVDEALMLHKDVFVRRSTIQGRSHHLTLGSQYNLAVCYHNVGDFEKAELVLRDNLANSCVTTQWRDEDVVRTKFRLSLVLRAREKADEAAAMVQEIVGALAEARLTVTLLTYTDEDDMKLLDFGVSLFHGRTSGIWSNGKFW